MTGKAKPARDDTAKELFESHEWARDDVTMERVAKSVLAYTFIKDGQVLSFLLECPNIVMA